MWRRIRKNENEKHQQKVYEVNKLSSCTTSIEYEFETSIWNSTPKNNGRNMWSQVCNSVWVILLPSMRLWVCSYFSMHQHTTLEYPKLRKSRHERNSLANRFIKFDDLETIKPFELPINDNRDRFFLMWNEFSGSIDWTNCFCSTNELFSTAVYPS